MKQPTIPKQIVHQYSYLQGDIEYQSYGNGHINETFLIKSTAGSFILQKVNPKVFLTDILVTNAEKLIPALEKYQQVHQCKLTPSFFKNNKGTYHSLDEQGAAWRLIEFIAGCKSYSMTTKTQHSYRGAQSLGQFQLFLNTLEIDQFGETIPHFHHPAARLQTFLEVLENTSGALKSQSKAEIAFVQKHQSIADEMEQLSTQGVIPRRITHNDPKLENILFTPDGQRLVIDLDTVMPSTILFDFGDMVRTFTPGAAEDDPHPDKAGLRIDHFEALTKGYLEQLKNALSPVEKAHLLMGAKAIIYEQSIRFLTDFLIGNTYYKVSYPEHNLVRTRTQIKLLSDILKHETRLNTIIQKNI
jgi:hypothetical protein